MTHRVPKSRAGDNFAAEVEAFARELRSWHAHMQKVGVDPEYVAHPAPSAPSPDVAAALNEAGEPDFEVFDDSPSAEEILRAKKNALLARIAVMEREAEAAVIPLGKRRHFSIIENDLRAADVKRKIEILKDQAARRLKISEEKASEASERLAGVPPRKIEALREKLDEELREALGSEITNEDAEAIVSKERDPEHTEFLARQEERRARLEEIRRHGSLLMHDVEDLTESKIDSWEPAPFPI